MHRSLSILRGSAIVLAAAAPWMVHGQSAVPPMQAQGDVKYVCAGIGQRQSTAMRDARCAMH